MPDTNYTYKITATYVDGFETTGLTKSVKTDKEPVPEIIGGVFEKKANGDYEFTWEEPIIGKVKILIDGKDYKIVNASDKKILIPKSDMVYDFFENPKVSLQPIGEYGAVGQVTNPIPLNPASGVSNPLSTKDLIGTGINLLWIVGPFLLLALVFLLVPKLRNLVFRSFRKSEINQDKLNEQDRRFKADKDIKDRQEKDQRDRQEKERLERKKRKEKAYLAKLEKNQEKVIASSTVIKEPRIERKTAYKSREASKRKNSKGAKTNKSTKRTK